MILIVIFKVMSQSNLVGGYHCFSVTCCLHVSCRRWRQQIHHKCWWPPTQWHILKDLNQNLQFLDSRKMNKGDWTEANAQIEMWVFLQKVRYSVQDMVMNIDDNQHTLINCELSMWSVRGAEIEHSTDTKWFIHCDPLTLVSSAVRTLRETHCHIVTMWLEITDVSLWLTVSISIHCEAAAKASTWRQDVTSAY